MRHHRIIFLLGILGIFALASCNNSGRSVAPDPAEMPIEDFSVTKLSGQLFELKRDSLTLGTDYIVFVFMRAGCRANGELIGQAESLAQRLTARKAALFYVDSSDRAAISAEASRRGITRPILIDDAHIVADSIGASSTETAAVIDTRTWRKVFFGSLADLAAAESKADNDLWFRSRPTPNARPVPGEDCEIARRSLPSPITYYQHVAPILAARCLGCHGAGGAPPRNMTTLQEVKGWAAMIHEVIRQAKMPLPEADPSFGHYTQSFLLSPEEKEILLNWTKGDRAAGTFTPATRLNFPRKIVKRDFSLPEIDLEVPAKSGGKMKTVFLGRAPKTLWIGANNRTISVPGVIHHIMMIYSPRPLEISDQPMAPPKYYRERDVQMVLINPLPDSPEIYPPGLAVKVPKGTYIYAELGFNGSGKPEKVSAKIYFELRDPATTKALNVFSLSNMDLHIPANDPGYRATVEYAFHHPRKIYWLNPHMHKRGRSAQVKLVAPDGTEKTVLSIPAYSFRHPREYRFVPPLLAPKGWKIRLEAMYDNSRFNPLGIDSNRPVEYSQDVDTGEMCVLKVVSGPDE